MNPIQEYIQQETRRQFFGRAAKGLGLAALASLLPVSKTFASQSDEMVLPHFAPKAKRAIYLFISGAPSQLDKYCLLYTSPSPRDRTRSRMPSSA